MLNVIAALAKVQAEMPGIQKDSVNPHFKNSYVSLNKLMEIVLPVLQENGLLLIQAPTFTDAGPGLETIITHVESGESWSAVMPLMLERDNPQGQGSAITYARRYALMSILGLVADEDDDGEKASPARKRRVVNKSASDPGLESEYDPIFRESFKESSF